MIVMKFGGSCLGKPSDIKRLVEIVRAAERDQPEIVLSAFKGVTDELIRQANLACSGSFDLEAIERKHRNFLADLPATVRAATETQIDQLLKNLRKTLETVITERELTAATMDEIVSYGERLAIQIASGYFSAENLKNSPLADLEAGLITDSRFGNASILDESYQLVRDKIQTIPLPVIAGFFGRDKAGRIATLGRGGTDYVAAFIASALHCDCVLFKDVEGILSADPKIVKNARLLTEVDYLTAMELAHYGSKVVFEKAIAPAMKSRVAIRVTSFLNPSQGTLIKESTEKATAVSLLKNVTNLRVSSSDSKAIQSFKQQLENHHADDLLSWADHSRNEISIAVRGERTEGMARMIEDALPNCEVKVTKGLCLAALTGSSLKTGDVREILLKDGIEVYAVSITVSGGSVCAVLDSERAEQAVRTLHSSVMT